MLAYFPISLMSSQICVSGFGLDMVLSRICRSGFGERPGRREEETLNTIKSTVKIAGFLLVVLLALGCGGPMRSPSAHANHPMPQPRPKSNHASSKFLYMVSSIEKMMQGFAIDAATGALNAGGPAVAADHVPIYAAATPDGKFLYVASAGTEASGVSAYRIDGLRGSLMPTAPAESATMADSKPFGIGLKRRRTK